VLRRLLTWLRGWWKRPPAPVPAPVHEKFADISEASAPTVRAFAPVLSEPTIRTPAKPRPSADVQAQALVEFLHRQHAGKPVPAAWVKSNAYPRLVEAMGWRTRAWDGTGGVGHHLGQLTGGRGHAWFEVASERKRLRAYHVPIAITVRKRA
jgi:hypothetical protein